MQWIAIHLPNLPLEAFPQHSPAAEPAAIVEANAVLVANEPALARGVRPGLGLSAAYALAPDLRAQPRDVRAESEALAALAGWALQFTPAVSIEPARGLLLEVGASLNLFGGLAPIARAVRDGVAAMGFTAFVAAAPTARGAWWLARGGRETLVADAAKLEPPLARLPVRVLDCDATALETFRAIGVATVGEALALPRAGVARRFGQRLLDELDRALGRLAEPRAFHIPPPTFSARLELMAEVEHAEPLLFAAKRLVLQLAGVLAARASGVQRFSLLLVHREKRVTEVVIGLVRPACDAEHFVRLLRERLDRVALVEPVRAIALAADAIVPLAGSDLALFRDPAAIAAEGWGPLVEQLRARLGTAAVHGVTIAAEHRPEYASPPAEIGTRASAPGFGPRPFWLLPAPQPLAEIDAVPHYGGPLALVAGPERIESGWWDGQPVARDYFVAQTPARALVWVFRERREAARWFLHGLFA